MFDTNVVYLAGRLGAEPEITTTSNGRKMVTLRVAVETNWKNKAGKWSTDTEWHRVVSFLPAVITRLSTFGRITGRTVYVQGDLRNRAFEEDGQKRFAVEIEAGVSGGVALLPEDRKGFFVNTVNLSGRLAADARIATRPGNKGKIAHFSVGIDRSYKDANGLWHNEAEWHRVVTTAPSHIDKVLAKDGTKGRVVQVQGQLRAREYTDQETGEVKTIHQIEADATGTILVIPEVRPKKVASQAAE